MLKSINVRATWECDICHEWSHNLELKVSVDGKKFNRDGWDAVEELLEQKYLNKIRQGRTVRITTDGEWIDVCPTCNSIIKQNEKKCLTSGGVST